MKAEICIPTYKRPEAINELLKRYFDMYIGMGFDLHIYDSSDDNKTKEVCRRYSDKSGFFYHLIDSHIHSNMKVYAIYEEFEKSDYDYIWVQSDSIRWTPESLTLIKDAIELDKYDVIIPNYRDVERIGNKEYTDINEFFEECAWHMTLYGATILRKSVMTRIDWNQLNERYGVPNRINFSHVGLYFEQISKMEKFRAYHIGLPKYSLTSTLFKKESGWRKDTFFIHFECWPSVINALPDVYNNKKEVIKKQGKYSDDLTVEGIKKLRSERVLTPEVVKKYAHTWEDVSDVSLAKVMFYAHISPNLAKDLLRDTRYEKKRKKRIKKFCEKYEMIYIFGCGQMGDLFAGYLEDMNVNYKGFLVSKGRQDKSVLHGKPVREVDLDIVEDEKNGIIFALNELNTRQVINSLGNIKVRAGIYTEHNTNNGTGGDL